MSLPGGIVRGPGERHVGLQLCVCAREEGLLGSLQHRLPAMPPAEARFQSPFQTRV